VAGDKGSPGWLSPERAAKERVAEYSADAEGKAVFTFAFDRDIELAGPLTLRLWVEADGGDDMDLFVKVEKRDRRGRLLFAPIIPVPNAPLRRLLPFLFRRGVKRLSRLYFTGPDGRLRVSRRALDRNEQLSPGEIVPVEIALRPLGMRWRAGEQLRVVVAGHNLSPAPLPGIAPPKLVNRGKHLIYTGGRYDSHLLLPVTPTP
jgi:predicted acyl esterase